MDKKEVIINYKKKKIVIIAFLLFLVFFSLMCLNMEYDYYWHLKVGEFIVENKLIPFTGVFSWFAGDLPWVAHEWATEALFYGLKNLFGNYSVIVYAFFCVASLFFILYWFNRKTILKKNINVVLLWFAMGTTLIITSLMPRPHIFSNVLLAITMYFLYDLLNNENSKKIYFLPLIALLWTNFHGGSSNLVYILPSIFLICGLFKFKKQRLESNRLSLLQIKKYILAIIISGSVIMINPNGWHMVVYPYINMQNTLMLTSISEWQVPNITSLLGMTIFLIVFILFLILIFTKKKIKLIDFILILMFTYLSLKSIRFGSLLFIVSSFLVFKYFKDVSIKKITKEYLIVYFTIIIILFIAFSPGYKFLIEKVNQKEISDKMILLIKENKPKYLYNDYGAGGYLIYKDIDVFIDGRADMYTSYNFKDFKYIEQNSKNTEALIEKYKLDMFIVSRKKPIYNYLKYNNKYKILLEDKKYALFEENE